jgi:hypothetical protein
LSDNATQLLPLGGPVNNPQSLQAALLPENETCQVFQGEKLIFTSQSHWLHPLFELNDFFLAQDNLSCLGAREDLFLRDRIIGRAAALMIAKMNILHCAAPIVSKRALPIFEMFHVNVEYDEIVPRLPCQTEDILEEITDPSEAWNILKKRAEKAKEAQR